MNNNEEARVWVNRVVAFLAGGLVVLAIMSFAVVAPVKSQNVTLTKQLEEDQNGAARLLAEANTLFQSGAYENARKTLNTLFEKQPASNEVTEGRELYAKIEAIVREMDRKWEAASGDIRTVWEENKAAELRAKFEQDRELMETTMSETLNKEWEKSKDKIRQEWEELES